MSQVFAVHAPYLQCGGELAGVVSALYCCVAGPARSRDVLHPLPGELAALLEEEVGGVEWSGVDGDWGSINVG